MAFPRRFYFSYPLVGLLGCVLARGQLSEVRALGPHVWGLAAIALVTGLIVGAMTCRAARSESDARPDHRSATSSAGAILLGISAAFYGSRTGGEALLIWVVAICFIGLAVGFFGYLASDVLGGQHEEQQ